jgi:hypothetical protein
MVRDNSHHPSGSGATMAKSTRDELPLARMVDRQRRCVTVPSILKLTNSRPAAERDNNALPLLLR